MNRSQSQVSGLPAGAEVVLALAVTAVPAPLLAHQLGAIQGVRAAIVLSIAAAAVTAVVGAAILARVVRERPLRLLPVLDRIIETGLLSALLIVPLAYSTRFSTTLILKETLSHTMALFLAAAWLSRGLIRGEIRYIRTPYNLAVGGLLVFSLVSLLWLHPKGTSSRDLFLFASYWVLFHLLCLEMRRRSFRRKVFACIVFAGCIVAAISLGQLLRWQVLKSTPFGGVWAPGQDPRLKVSSTIGHNISIATFFLALAFIQLGWVLTVQKRWQMVGALILFTLSSTIVFVSETRGVYVAFPIALLTLAILVGIFRGRAGQTVWKTVQHEARRRLLLLLLVIGLGFSLAGALLMKSKRIDPLARLSTLRPGVLVPGTRVRLWTISLEMIKDHPLRGLGFEAFKYRYPLYQARYFDEHPDTKMVPTERHTDRVHNEYLQVWVELGAFGLVGAILLLALHTRFMWRQTRRASHRIRQARDDLYRTVLFAGIVAALVDAFFHFYLHVASDALMFLLLLASVVATSRPLRLSGVKFPSFAKRPRLARAAAVCLLLVAVTLSVFGPGAVGALLPFESSLKTFRGPVCHALADAIYTPEERSLAPQFRRLSTLQILLKTPNQKLLTDFRSEYLPPLQRSIDRFIKSREISGYRGQVSFYAGQTLARLGELYGQLAPAEAALGWHEATEKTRKDITESFQQARHQLHRATEEYQFRHIYYELGKVDYYLAVQARNEDPELARQLMDEAEAGFKTAAQIYPPSVDYHHDLAKFLLTARRDSASALEQWKKAYRLDPGLIDSRLLVEAKAQAGAGRIELAEGLYRAAYELGREFMGLYGELTYGLRLCEFYSVNGMPDRLEQVALSINSRYHDRSEAFWLAAQYLGVWGRTEDLKQLVFAELEKRPLGVPYFERCLIIDQIHQHQKEFGPLVAFWNKVAGYPAEPEVAPRVRAQLGYRLLTATGDAAASFAAFSDSGEQALGLPPDHVQQLGRQLQEQLFPFLLPLVIR